MGNRPANKEMERLGAADIWVTMSPDTVASRAEKYRAIRGLGLCEEGFADMAKTVFFRRGHRSLAAPEDRLWRGERMLQLICPPKERTYCYKPPIVEAGAAEVEYPYNRGFLREALGLSP